MNRFIVKIGISILLLSVTGVDAQEVKYAINKTNGSMERISIAGDKTEMNWIMATDGSQYPWVDSVYSWGLGYFKLVMEGRENEWKSWTHPSEVEETSKRVLSRYRAGDIGIEISRYVEGKDLVEKIQFINKGDQSVRLEDIAINTPFNDNYPDAVTCYYGRANAHIWAGESNAYINAMHMSGKGLHLGLALTEGMIKNYEIRERSVEKGLSNTRGVILLNPENISLEPNGIYTLEWRLFSHNGQEDFYQKLVSYGSVVGKSKQYVYELGDTASIEFEHNGNIETAAIDVNGKDIEFVRQGNNIVVKYSVTESGEMVFTLNYNGGKRTHVKCLAISSEEKLIKKRVNFIIDHQQYNNSSDSRDGAYLVYDNEIGEIYLNEAQRSDCDEGRERLGMGVLLALQYQKTGDKKIKESLLKYARFVRTLQREDYTTFSTADHRSKDRAYNYPWVSSFYFEMFHVTGEKEFLLHGYHTLKAMYRRHGHDFYAIDIPVKAYHIMKENGFEKEATSILEDFKKSADAYAANGWNYPKSEVNYEQAIVAPSIIHLLRIYLITDDKKYLESAELQLPLLESFTGFQPSYYLNEIALRHWDGYWFGKYRLWGDTFPHYWNTLNALAYSLYADITGDTSYQERAENIVRNNLCQFFEDGSASCAFIYPDKIDGKSAHLFDPYANDQDWALVYFYLVNSAKQHFKLTKF